MLEKFHYYKIRNWLSKNQILSIDFQMLSQILPEISSLVTIVGNWES